MNTRPPSILISHCSRKSQSWLFYFKVFPDILVTTYLRHTNTVRTQPCIHMTLFLRLYKVYNVGTTSYKRQNDVNVTISLHNLLMIIVLFFSENTHADIVQI